jgi:hypothetical protein
LETDREWGIDLERKVNEHARTCTYHRSVD